MAFKDVGPICRLEVRLQENPDGTYFDGWTFDKVLYYGMSSQLLEQELNFTERLTADVKGLWRFLVDTSF